MVYRTYSPVSASVTTHSKDKCLQLSTRLVLRTICKDEVSHKQTCSAVNVHSYDFTCTRINEKQGKLLNTSKDYKCYALSTLLGDMLQPTDTIRGSSILPSLIKGLPYSILCILGASLIYHTIVPMWLFTVQLKSFNYTRSADIICASL